MTYILYGVRESKNTYYLLSNIRFLLEIYNKRLNNRNQIKIILFSTKNKKDISELKKITNQYKKNISYGLLITNKGIYSGYDNIYEYIAKKNIKPTSSYKLKDHKLKSNEVEGEIDRMYNPPTEKGISSNPNYQINDSNTNQQLPKQWKKQQRVTPNVDSDSKYNLSSDDNKMINNVASSILPPPGFTSGFSLDEDMINSVRSFKPVRK